MNSKTLSLIRAVPALGLLLLAVPAGAIAAICYPLCDNGDGTVTDKQTGLMWDKCSWSQNWISASNTCSTNPAATTHTWTNALAVAVTANTNNHRDYNDWRLPSKNELESLVDITKATSPTIDTTAFPNTPGSYFWTSTTYAPGPAVAWRVGFNYGDTYADNKALSGRVRLVRSGQSFDDFDLLSAPVTRNGDFTAPVLSGQTYTAGAVLEGPAGRFSFTARFCNKSSSVDTLLGLFSRTAVLTNGNSLINRDRDGSGSPPGGVGSELDFPFTGQYSDGLLAPGECVDVPYVIGLQQKKSFSFYVDVSGY